MMNFAFAVSAVMVIILFEAASSQLVMIPCLAIRPPAAHIAHVGGDGVVGARTVFVKGEFEAKCQPSGDDFYDFSRANFSVVNATEGHVRAVYHNVEVSDPSHARPVAGMSAASSRGLRPYGLSCPPPLTGMERCDVDLVVVGLDRFRLAVDAVGGRSSDVYLLRGFAAASHVASADSFDFSDLGTEFDISDADKWERCETGERGRAGEIRCPVTLEKGPRVVRVRLPRREVTYFAVEAAPPDLFDMLGGGEGGSGRGGRGLAPSSILASLAFPLVFAPRNAF